VDVVLFGFVNFKKLLDYVQEYYPFFEYNCFVILKKYFNNILVFFIIFMYVLCKIGKIGLIVWLS
jgi:hypothetical protein